MTRGASWEDDEPTEEDLAESRLHVFDDDRIIAGRADGHCSDETEVAIAAAIGAAGLLIGLVVLYACGLVERPQPGEWKTYEQVVGRQNCKTLECMRGLDK